ncbi:MAG TPA: hypothetical protein VHU40_18025 [Polyangia bacterium]|nr:hypothetical protein [Polyangia bacterium]
MPVPAFVFLMGLWAPLMVATAGGAAQSAVVAAEPLASRGLVIVLRPPEVDEMTRMALARIHAELGAARFRVQVMPLDPAREPGPQVESVGYDAHPVAVFAIAHITDREGDTIAIWVSDRVGRRTTTQRMAIRGENIKQDAEVLALEAIELIRISIAGLWPGPRPVTPPNPAPSPPKPPAPVAAVEPPAPPPAPPPSPVPPPALVEAPVGPPPATIATTLPPWSAGDRPEIAIGLGVAGLRDSGGQAMHWLGALTALARWRRGFAARASLSALGSSATLGGAAASASVRQLLVSAGAAWFWALEGPADVYVAASLGAGRVATSGASNDPARATMDGSGWVPTGTGGLGAQVRVSQRFSLAAAAEVLWAWARLDVRLGESKSSPLLRPAGLFTVALQASF